jgi:hypothetical protein
MPIFLYTFSQRSLFDFTHSIDLEYLLWRQIDRSSKMAFGYTFSVAVFAAIGTFLFVSRGQTGTSGITTNQERDLILESQPQVSISYSFSGQGLTCTISNCSCKLD